MDEKNQFDQLSMSNSAFVPAKTLLIPKATRYLIDGLVEEKSLSMLFALPGVGKTFLGLDWGLSISTDTSWQGRAVIQGAVFYLAGEGHAGLSRRLRAWEVARGVDLSQAPFFVSRAPGNLLQRESIEVLVNEIERMVTVYGKPALIIVDTYARNMGGGDENSNSDANVIVNHLAAIRDHLDCSILIIHHTGHGDDGRPRGASSLPAAMDSIFRLAGKPKVGTHTDLRLVHVKSKESELLPDIHLKIQQVDLPGWLDTQGRVMNSAIVVPNTAPQTILWDEITGNTERVLKALISSARTRGRFDETGQLIGVDLNSWRNEAFASLTSATPAAKKKAFQRARADLVEDGLIAEENGLFRLAGAASALSAGVTLTLSQDEGGGGASSDGSAGED